jgi:hypothetical protein
LTAGNRCKRGASATLPAIGKGRSACAPAGKLRWRSARRDLCSRRSADTGPNVMVRMLVQLARLLALASNATRGRGHDEYAEQLVGRAICPNKLKPSDRSQASLKRKGLGRLRIGRVESRARSPSRQTMSRYPWCLIS